MKGRTSQEKEASMPDDHGKQEGTTTPKRVIHEVNKRKVKAWREQLPPKEVFEKFTQQGEFTETQVKILNAVYSDPTASMTKIAKQVGVAKNSVKHAVDKLISLYKNRVAQIPESQRSNPSRIDNARREQQKLTPKEEKLSAKTTTFREVDKAVAQALGVDFHNTAIKKEIYARLGELLIYTLLQAGITDRDKIVEYSQRIVDNPEALYSYIKRQLDALIKSADTKTIVALQEENQELKVKVKTLENECAQLKNRLNECMETAEYIIRTLLTEDQLKSLYIWIIERDTIKRRMDILTQQKFVAIINSLISQNNELHEL
ncbi:winged helix-turn-helix transcriptional regulator [Thermococcus gorgonarius]|uniref:Uncharacterized protein n=1 Tax=Thermococcus gorgonarius TaxID=71997 RepID=A0A2Z2M9K7_THEGO|nr:winged helix-turn-helix transcriptional regulator [Thermococcus gorgonarius]ASJ01162.1 hypothetical protein A3K92_06535 [Thermococcus gorgonarius]